MKKFVLGFLVGLGASWLYVSYKNNKEEYEEYDDEYEELVVPEKSNFNVVNDPAELVKKVKNEETERAKKHSDSLVVSVEDKHRIGSVDIYRITEEEYNEPFFENNGEHDKLCAEYDIDNDILYDELGEEVDPVSETFPFSIVTPEILGEMTDEHADVIYVRNLPLGVDYMIERKRGREEYDELTKTYKEELENIKEEKRRLKGDEEG